MGKIVVAGSSNMDMVVKTSHIPAPGETVLSGSFFMNPGGKGANQAVAAARLGGSTSFISKLGNDPFGHQFSQLLAAEGIDTSHVTVSPHRPTGVALITVDERGENSIVVAPGANASLHINDIKAAHAVISDADILLLQLEIPLDTVTHAALYAAQQQVKVILNPAPALALPNHLLRCISILTPNTTEAALIAGIPVSNRTDAEKAAKIICAKGVQQVIVTMGADGVIICEEKNCSWIPAAKVTPVDSTAAGDVFNGALSVALCEGKNLHTAARFACDAAAISVTRWGAQSSIPYRHEL